MSKLTDGMFKQQIEEVRKEDPIAAHVIETFSKTPDGVKFFKALESFMQIATTAAGLIDSAVPSPSAKYMYVPTFMIEELAKDLMKLKPE